MIVGLRDRYGDMTWDNPVEGMPDGEWPAATAGDLLRANRVGSSWRLEPATEFFRQDAGPGMTIDGLQDEIAVGGLARVHTEDVTVAMAMSPLRLGAGGALWFRNETGENTWREELYAQDASVRFQKANGHGDVERLCGPVPPPDPPGELPTRVPSPTATGTRTLPPTVTRTSTIAASATPTDEPTATEPPTPTPTASSLPPPTHTSSVTATATPSGTATPRPTVTRQSQYIIYLPFNWQPSACRWQSRSVDVALVLDRSTSMLRSVEPGGLPKNEAAVEAARRFVRLLRLADGDPTDRVSVVGFNEEAWVETGLTARRDVAERALERIAARTAEGTRLDLAFGVGAAVLADHRAGSEPVMIVLTDGLPNRVPTRPPAGSEEDAVLWSATAAKAAGIRVFTVGLGEPSDILHGLLIAAASRPSDYYYAPDASQLGAIYESIAAAVRRCP
jgi:Mg-chelatase subunit ChlD